MVELNDFDEYEFHKGYFHDIIYDLLEKDLSNEKICDTVLKLPYAKGRSWRDVHSIVCICRRLLEGSEKKPVIEAVAFKGESDFVKKHYVGLK